MAQTGRAGLMRKRPEIVVADSRAALKRETFFTDDRPRAGYTGADWAVGAPLPGARKPSSSLPASVTAAAKREAAGTGCQRGSGLVIRQRQAE